LDQKLISRITSTKPLAKPIQDSDKTRPCNED